jgi:branched-chain amino acid aminotransferase|tara:strand:+ start:373 stop:1287 length:915 start_codon:yes stop_codon:yes gene_type:complete
MSSDKSDYAWMDGDFVKWEDAKVPILTHALHYGTGVFEGIRAYPSEDNLNIFRLKDHIDRMMYSAKIYYINCKYTAKDIMNRTVELVVKNNLKTRTYIRPIIYVGYKGIGLNFTGFPINAAIIAIPFEDYFDTPMLKLRISSWRRLSEQSIPPMAKACGNYLNSVLAKLEAVRDGYDDAIMLDIHGLVSEGTGENIFTLNGDELITPPYSSSILPGITRDTVKHLAHDLGLKVIERQMTRFELYNADEAFFSGTAAEIAPIVEVDQRMIGRGEPGKWTMKISAAFRKVVTSENSKYQKWLTPVY